MFETLSFGMVPMTHFTELIHLLGISDSVLQIFDPPNLPAAPSIPAIQVQQHYPSVRFNRNTVTLSQ